jgi:hypothetical protein
VSLLGWSYGRLRARLVLLAVALGFVAGLHAVAPARAHAEDQQCDVTEPCSDDGTGGGGYGGGGSGTGGDWGDTGGGGDWGDTGGGGDWGDTGGGGDWGDTGGDPGNGWGDPSDTGGDPGDTWDTGGDLPDGATVRDANPQQTDREDPMPPEDPIPPDDPMPPEDPLDTGAIRTRGPVDPGEVCAAERDALLVAPRNSAAEAHALSELFACLDWATASTAGAPGSAGSVPRAAVPTPQMTQAHGQLQAANLAARAATQAAMRAAVKAEQQAGRSSARRSSAKRKAGSRRHVKQRRG